jgi:hypothetical protein
MRAWAFSLILATRWHPRRRYLHRKMIDTKEFLRTVYQYGGLTYDETENQVEGLRRPLSNRPRQASGGAVAKIGPETGDIKEEIF